jgi:2-polyprenyl-3-methyl-5-hydroxy-6-metoxy-1,4-benzoquinol methylase
MAGRGKGTHPAELPAGAKAVSTERFDKMAADWEQNPTHRQIAVAVAAAISECAKLDKKTLVMDYGCGTGLLSFLLSGEVGGVLAADISGGMLEQVRSKIASQGVKNVRAMRFDITKGHKGVGQFDLITSAMTLHHIEDVRGALGGLADMLKPGGWLAAADLCSEDGSFHSDTVPAHKGLDAEDLSSHLRSIGLEDVSWRVIYQVKKNDRRYPVFCLLGRKCFA